MAGEAVSIHTGLPLADLDPNARQLVQRVLATKQPVGITENGRVAVVVVEAEEYRRQQQRLHLLERIAQAEEDFAAGRVHTQAEAEAVMDRLLTDRG